MIIEDNTANQLIKVQCKSCGGFRNVLKKEHVRRCKRISKIIDYYLCPKCYNDLDVVKQNRINSLRKTTSSDEFRKKASNNSKKFWSGLDDKQREQHAIKCGKGVLNNKTSISIKNKFRNPDYVNKISIARKKYWDKKEYRDKKVVIGKQLSKNGEACFDLLKQWTGQKLQMVNFNFNDVNIKSIDNFDAVSFVQKYHYSYSLGHGRSQIRYGAYLNNQLIAVCCYASLTRNETAFKLNCDHKKIRELVRFCVKPGFNKKNFSSFFLSKTIDLIRDDRPDICLLVTFADETYGHIGTIYKATNWVYDGLSEKSYWYVSDDGKTFHKKTVYNHARKMGMRESDYCQKHGLSRIWGKQKRRFFYKLRDYEN